MERLRSAAGCEEGQVRVSSDAPESTQMPITIPVANSPSMTRADAHRPCDHLMPPPPSPLLYVACFGSTTRAAGR
jgi:hypothetical protein